MRRKARELAACVCTQHTHEAQVTRPFTDGHVELCDMMATGVKKAGRLPAFELGVAYQIVNPGSSTLLSATLRSQACGHGKISRRCHGHQHSGRYRIEAVSAHTSDCSSDFAQPKVRHVGLGWVR